MERFAYGKARRGQGDVKERVREKKSTFKWKYSLQGDEVAWQSVRRKSIFVYRFPSASFSEASKAGLCWFKAHKESFNPFRRVVMASARRFQEGKPLRKGVAIQHPSEAHKSNL